ncbi:TDP-N-acetylfucosamine:lipid II N-acetylfucosaminyltransferase [Flavobacterium branchiicola]|uniref:TDP-N-acetylfucosamine:lipid II N-acetylfucosaminyltransferase n=1 Tax=Flavobacterium branchiicola TaxID=1114875 RepID=A0ABV9PK50_9FLAO|nr:TDP-N-acetylfucosamine:lipid II N-acetylfucosaminyltransferase [Flavobacterium branchiicola]MBS7255475.1 TDP-N-acetylfucosamine:lipid II N-acetylfucosaminyltransferase [Flavobacterium branchiicola]
MSLKIIHVFDDDKFVDPAIDLFEAVFPGISEYYILKKNDEQFKYVKSSFVRKITLKDDDEFSKFIFKVNNNKNVSVFFHALDESKQKISLQIHSSIIKVWFIWGYDLYCNWPIFRKNIYDLKTRQVLKEKTSIRQTLLFNVFSFYIFKNIQIFKYILPQKIISILDRKYNTYFYKAVSNINIVVPIMPEELSLVLKLNKKIKEAPFTYGCLEDLLGDKINQKVIGTNILVGNSADFSNNHLEIFYKLSKLNLKNTNVYVPLSYGGSKEYIDTVIKVGEKLLGDNFIPIIEFMPLEDYNRILLSCRALIFNHVRQQGLGNIIIMGYLGAKIYLNNKSPIYKYLKKIGYTLESTNNLNLKNFQENLKEEKYLNNKKILFELYSRQSVHEKVKRLISIVQNLKVTS